VDRENDDGEALLAHKYLLEITMENYRRLCRATNGVFVFVANPYGTASNFIKFTDSAFEMMQSQHRPVL